MKKKETKNGMYYVSEKKKSELYRAINDPITDLRIDIAKQNRDHESYIDKKLSDIHLEIWRSIAAILKIKNP